MRTGLGKLTFFFSSLLDSFSISSFSCVCPSLGYSSRLSTSFHVSLPPLSLFLFLPLSFLFFYPSLCLSSLLLSYLSKSLVPLVHPFSYLFFFLCFFPILYVSLVCLSGWLAGCLFVYLSLVSLFNSTAYVSVSPSLLFLHTATPFPSVTEFYLTKVPLYRLHFSS